MINLKCILSNDLVTTLFEDNEKIENNLEEYLEMIDLIKTHGNERFQSLFDANNFAINCIFDDQGSQVDGYAKMAMLARSNPSLKDSLHEFQIKLGKSIGIESEYYAQCVPLNRNILKNLDQIIFLGSESNEEPIVCTNSFLKAKRFSLANYCVEEEFYQEISYCFWNTYFNETVRTSIRTLNSSFLDLRDEIVEQLTAIDSFYNESNRESRRAQDFRTQADCFETETAISCSTQGNRIGVQNLNYIFYNCLSGKNEQLCCEMHTKFKTYNRDKTKQDRVYFHPGKQGILYDKVIVVHIGTHL